jgi:membrane-associated protein
LAELIDLLLNVDDYMLKLVDAYGNWAYGILFLIIFVETGLVIWPFLPGDSLLFTAGAVAATTALDIRIMFVLLVSAAVAGDTMNYWIGRFVGQKIIHLSATDRRWGRWVNPGHMARASEFFEHHGGKAVVLARFIPIVRTFVPFVAGAADMRYRAFTMYNVSGALVWVALCLGAGYLFGNIPVVKENFSLVALGIVLVSLMPMGVEYLRQKRRNAGTLAQKWSRSSDLPPGQD